MLEIRAAERPLPPSAPKTPWLLAAAGSLVTRMEKLDQSELHSTDKWGGALHYAVCHDHATAVRWLLERHIAVDARTSQRTG